MCVSVPVRCMHEIQKKRNLHRYEKENFSIGQEKWYDMAMALPHISKTKYDRWERERE